MKRLTWIALADLGAAAAYGLVWLCVRLANPEQVENDPLHPGTATSFFFFGPAMMFSLVAVVPLSVGAAFTTMQSGGIRLLQYVLKGIAVSVIAALLVGVGYNLFRIREDTLFTTLSMNGMAAFGLLLGPPLSLLVSVPLWVRADRYWIANNSAEAEAAARKQYEARRDQWEQERNAPRCPFCDAAVSPVAATEESEAAAHCGRCGNWLGFVVVDTADSISTVR